MKKEIYSDPNEVYNFMNSWTRIKTSYETQFKEKNVTNVNIYIKNGKPFFLVIHYQ